MTKFKFIQLSLIICGSFSLFLGCSKDEEKDLLVPSAIIVFPTNEMIISESVLIKTEIFDNKSIDKVELFIDGEKETSLTPPYEHIWETSDLINNTQHTIYIKAYDASGNKCVSNIVTVLVNNESKIIYAPTSLIAKSNDKNSIDLSWIDNSLNEKGFKIEMSIDDNSDFIEISETNSDDTTKTINNLNPSQIYYFRIYGYNNETTSDYSNEASTMTLSTKPYIQKVSRTDDKISYAFYTGVEESFLIEGNNFNPNSKVRINCCEAVNVCFINDDSLYVTFNFPTYLYGQHFLYVYNDEVVKDSIEIEITPIVQLTRNIYFQDWNKNIVYGWKNNNYKNFDPIISFLGSDHRFSFCVYENNLFMTSNYGNEWGKFKVYNLETGGYYFIDSGLGGNEDEYITNFSLFDNGQKILMQIHGDQNSGISDKIYTMDIDGSELSLIKSISNGLVSVSISEEHDLIFYNMGYYYNWNDDYTIHSIKIDGTDDQIMYSSDIFKTNLVYSDQLLYFSEVEEFPINTIYAIDMNGAMQLEIPNFPSPNFDIDPSGLYILTEQAGINSTFTEYYTDLVLYNITDEEFKRLTFIPNREDLYFANFSF